MTSRPPPRSVAPGSISLSRLGFWVLGVALLARGLYVLQLARTPDLLLPLFDAQGYVARANQWIRGRGLSPEVFEFSLLYHLFLSAVFFLTDAAQGFARAVQVGLGSLTCLLLALTTARHYGRREGLLAGLLAAWYAPAVVLNAELMPSTLEALWWVGLLAMSLSGTTEGPRTLLSRVGWGLLGGLGILLGLRSGLAWLILHVVVHRGRADIPRPPRARLILWSSVLAPVLVAYVLLGHIFTSGTLTRLALQTYLANSGDLDQTLTLRPGPEFFSMMEKAQQNADVRDLSPARYWAEKNVQAVREHPWRVVSGLGEKTLHLVSSRELPGALDIRAFREANTWVHWLFWEVGRVGFPAVLVLALAAIGLVVCGRAIPRAHLALVVSLSVFLALGSVTASSRLPWLLLLLPWSGVGAVALPGLIRAPGSRTAWRAGWAALLGVVISCVPGPFGAERALGKAELYRAIGQTFMQDYRMDRAREYFDLALSLDPSDAQAWNGLGACQQMNGHLAEARTSFAKAYEQNPEYTYALFNLAKVEASLGRAREAVALLGQGLARQPRNGQAHHDLGNLYVHLGQPELAIDHFQQACALNPTVFDPRLNLADALRRAGRLKEAEEALRIAIQMAPLEARAHAALGLVQLRLGQAAAAEGHLLSARTLNPSSAETRYGLAALYLQANQLDEARRWYTNGLALDGGAGADWLTPDERERLAR